MILRRFVEDFDGKKDPAASPVCEMTFGEPEARREVTCATITSGEGQSPVSVTRCDGGVTWSQEQIA
jgi:hypothetical protein